jgi:hypothetical protein
MKGKFVAIMCLVLAFTLAGLGAYAESDDKGRVTLPSANDGKGRVTLPTANMSTVPNVVGMAYKSAIPVIQAAGFNATRSGGVSLSAAINKTIVTQTPAAGTKALKGTFVTVGVK